MDTIYTSRLYLRQFNVGDITDAYLNALRDEQIIGLTEARHVNWTYEKVVEYIKKSNEEGVSLLLGLFLKTNNIHIGNIRLFGFHPIHKRVELGIMIYDNNYWGKGYGTEALIAVADYVFIVLKYHRIIADYYSSNIGSAKIFKKAGYTIEGVFKDHFYINGTYIDSVRIGLINPNY